MECNVLNVLEFEMDYPTIYDFVIYHLEMLLLNIKDQQKRKYYQSVYCRPQVLLKIFEIIDNILLDIESLRYKPSLIASCLLNVCFKFEDWSQGVKKLTNEWSCNLGYIPELSTPTPSPYVENIINSLNTVNLSNTTNSSNSVGFAKLGGQINNVQVRNECDKFVSKYLKIKMKYWEPPKNVVFDYKKRLTNNVLTYQTWQEMPNLISNISKKI